MADNEAENAAEPFPEAVRDKALSELRSLLKGNGISADKLAFVDLEGKLYPIRGYTRIEVGYKRAQGKSGKKRRKENFQKIENADALQDAIETKHRELCEKGDKRKHIVNKLLDTQDRGFNPEGYTLDLGDYNCSFMVPRECGNCHKSGHVTCQNCHGNKEVTCRLCQGSTQMTCPQCQGSSFIQGPNGHQQCQRCSGQGHVNCDNCRSSGRVPCTKCGSRGSMTCQSCGGTGWQDDITHIAFHATTRLEYNTQELPRGLVRILHKQAGDLAAGQAIALKTEEDNTSTSKDTIYVHYNGTMPYGKMHLRLKDKKFSVIVYGHDVHMDEVPPFLEHVCSSGIKALKSAANASNVATALETAGQYHLLRQALLLTSQHKPRQALPKLVEQYRHGIRQSSLKGLVIKSDQALRNITKTPRLIGLGIGLICSMLIIFGYYLQAQSYFNLTAAWQAGLLDIGIVVLCVVLTSTCIHLMAMRALRRIFAHIGEEPENLQPRIDLSVSMGVSAVIGIYLLSIAILTSLSDKTPFWAKSAYTMLRDFLF